MSLMFRGREQGDGIVFKIGSGAERVAISQKDFRGITRQVGATMIFTLLK